MAEIWLCFYCHPESGYLRRIRLNRDYNRKQRGKCRSCGREDTTVWSQEKMAKQEVLQK